MPGAGSGEEAKGEVTGSTPGNVKGETMGTVDRKGVFVNRELFPMLACDCGPHGSLWLCSQTADGTRQGGCRNQETGRPGMV